MQRTRENLSRLAAAGAVALLAACAETDPAYDPVEWARDARRGVAEALGNDPPPKSPRVEPPPAAGRPYPNLASVPPRPERMSARQRDADLRELSGQRDAAVERDRALRAGGPTAGEPAPSVDGRYVGSVIPDAIGAFGPGDERLLRQAVDSARDNAGTVRLEGEAEAGLAVVDRLAALGLAREQVELIPTRAAGASGRLVEIFVAYEPRKR